MVSLAFLGTEISSGFEAYHVVAIHMDECMDACMDACMHACMDGCHRVLSMCTHVCANMP